MAYNRERRDQATCRHPRTTAVAVADQLQRELALLGITTDLNDGYGLAVVSVWRDLIVWTNGERFWWCEGWNYRRTRPLYAWLPTADPRRAARRIAKRYGELRGVAPASPPPTSRPYDGMPFQTGDLG